MSFIDYKGTADWLLLLASILKWIADRLILYPNHQSIERKFKSSCWFYFGFLLLLRIL